MNPSVPHFARIVSLGTLLAFLALCGCSVRKLAVNKLGDALSGSGSSFAGDDDPELVRQAIPFSLKLMESLLAEAPEHRELLRATSSGFTQYAYAFVQQDADELEAKDFTSAETLRARARKLYLRARNYGLRGLESAHPGFTNELFRAPGHAVRMLKTRDVPAVYWTAASWGALIALSKDDPARVAEIPQMETLIDRAAALDADWGDGSIHSFLINYEMSRHGLPGDPALRARNHFQRAVELAKGHLAGPFVTYAEAVCIEKQDLREFESLLGKALAIDPGAHPEYRLVNEVMQRRARWLLSRKDDLFLSPAAPTQTP